jgi:hypothetical protein
MQKNSPLLASVTELAQAYLEAQHDNNPVLAEFWRVELLSRLVMVCDGIGSNR